MMSSSAPDVEQAAALARGRDPAIDDIVQSAATIVKAGFVAPVGVDSVVALAKQASLSLVHLNCLAIRLIRRDWVGARPRHGATTLPRSGQAVKPGCLGTFGDSRVSGLPCTWTATRYTDPRVVDTMALSISSLLG